ncbi:hypothetical protein ABH916_001655 [Peribacillus frigoritolerans]|uniref:hypothetical protein n=1 Tax=Peribacillus frigoritolerans TaxID=450367 RepID=UPI0038324D01
MINWKAQVERITILSKLESEEIATIPSATMVVAVTITITVPIAPITAPHSTTKIVCDSIVIAVPIAVPIAPITAPYSTTKIVCDSVVISVPIAIPIPIMIIAST